MSRVPTINVSFQLAAIGLAQPLRVLIVSQSTAGEDLFNTPKQILDADDASDFFGNSDGADAARRFFALGLQSTFELWGFAVDDATWTANTWDLVFTGTALAAGSNVFRFGDRRASVNVAKDDDGDAAATAFAAAINGSATIPASAVAAPAVAASLDLDPLTANVDTVIAAAVAGTAGNNTTIELVADGTGVGTLDESGFPAIVFHFEALTTTVANFETAIAASTNLVVQTPGTGGNIFASPGDVLAATNLAGGTDATVTVTSTYVGEHTRRIPVSVDLYRARGERGVSGLTVVVTNNEDATGTPAAFTTTNLPAQPYLWYLTAFQTTAFLDDLEAWLSDRWDNANNYAIALTAFNGSAADAATLGNARNSQYLSVTAAADAPEYELQTAVSVLDTLEEQMQLQLSDGERTGAATINVDVDMNAPTINLDPQTLLDAAVSVLRVIQTTVTAVSIVTTKDETATAEDLRLFDIATVLRARHLGERIVAALGPELGKAIVQPGQQLSPSVAKSSTSADEIRDITRAVMRKASEDALVSMLADDAAAAITGVQTLTAGGIDTGFSLNIDPVLAKNSRELRALISIR